MNTPAPIAIIRAHVQTIVYNQLDIAEWINSPEFDEMQCSTLESLGNLLELLAKWEKTDQARNRHTDN